MKTQLTNIEYADFMATQLPADTSPEHIAGFKQGIILALNASKSEYAKAAKWDALDDKISKYYNVESDDDEHLRLLPIDGNDTYGELDAIGEEAATAFGYL